MAEDEWMKAAMGDDSMVAELLIRIKHSEPASVPKIQKMPSTMKILEWGLRQSRSRKILMMNIRCSSSSNNTNTVQKKKKKKKGPGGGGGGGGGESTRASPTTPLSWSGGSSLSSGGCEDGRGIGIGDGGCGVDGYEEESSRSVKLLSGGGSNNKVVTGTNERTIRRSRKKKTFAQLKEEESLLLKEKIHLKKELATLRNTCEEQKAINNKLKRMKAVVMPQQHMSGMILSCQNLDCQSQSSTQPSRDGDVSKEGIYDQSCHMENNPSTIIFPPTTTTFNGMDDSAICSSSLPFDPCIQQMDTAVVRESLFELPDLNLPLEEDSSTEVLYGMS